VNNVLSCNGLRIYCVGIYIYIYIYGVGILYFGKFSTFDRERIKQNQEG
jgi:hypothetical protein